MNKAFDTVDRRSLFKDLTELLKEDELHMISILLKDVTLQVKIENNMGRVFTITVGVPQRDHFSPVLFIVYLAKALRREITDHIYARQISYDEMIELHIIDDT